MMTLKQTERQTDRQFLTLKYLFLNNKPHTAKEEEEAVPNQD